MGLTSSPTADFLLLAIVLLIGAHSWMLHAQGRWLAFDPLNAFWAGVLVCYVEQPIVHAEQLEAWHEAGIMEQTLFWVLFALIFIIVGYELRSGRRIAAKLPWLPPRLDQRKIVNAAAIFTVLGVLGYVYIMESAGGAGKWLSVGRGATDWIRVSAYLALLVIFLPVGVSLLLFDVEFRRSRPTARIIAWSLASLMCLWFVYLGSRSRTLGFAAMTMAAWYLPRHRNPHPLMLGGVLLALVLVTNFETRYREHFTNLSFNIDQIEDQNALEHIVPGWLTGRRTPTREASRGMEFNCVMTVVELVPDQVDYSYGYGLLEFVTRPVPRAIWADKPYPALEAVYPLMKQGELSSTYVATSKKPLLMGPALTFVGYWYATGGPIALAIAGIFTGILLRMIRSIHDRFVTSEAHLILFSYLFMIGFLEAAATPLVWLFSVPFALVPLFLLLRSAAPREIPPMPTLVRPETSAAGDPAP